MVELTKRQIEFLIKNEDRYTIRKFAKLFKCTPKEVYETYDRITDTPEYKKYILEKVATITDKIKKGEKKNEQMERTGENRQGEKKRHRISPLLYASSNNSGITSSGFGTTYGGSWDK
jgi:hypothetical protein